MKSYLMSLLLVILAACGNATTQETLVPAVFSFKCSGKKPDNSQVINESMYCFWVQGPGYTYSCDGPPSGIVSCTTQNYIDYRYQTQVSFRITEGRAFTMLWSAPTPLPLGWGVTPTISTP